MMFRSKIYLTDSGNKECWYKSHNNLISVIEDFDCVMET